MKTNGINNFNFQHSIEAVAIGCSAGGLEALKYILKLIPESFSLPLVIVIHISESSPDLLPALLSKYSSLTAYEAQQNQKIEPGNIYTAPAGYHLLVEDNKYFSLSCDEKVCYCRPSIDVLFESMSYVYSPALLGIILTGSNQDGSEGLKQIKQDGGQTIVQTPEESEFSAMPLAALKSSKPDYIMSLKQIANVLSLLKSST